MLISRKEITWACHEYIKCKHSGYMPKEKVLQFAVFHIWLSTLHSLHEREMFTFCSHQTKTNEYVDCNTHFGVLLLRVCSSFRIRIVLQRTFDCFLWLLLRSRYRWRKRKLSKHVYQKYRIRNNLASDPNVHLFTALLFYYYYCFR